VLENRAQAKTVPARPRAERCACIWVSVEIYQQNVSL
jgi:hypothetical protein